MFIPNKTYIVCSMIYSLKWPLLQYFNTIHSYIHTWLYLLWGNCMQTLLLIGKYSNRLACTRQKKCETQLGNACCSILCGFLSLWSVLRVTCWVYAFLFLAVRLCCLTRAHLQHMFSNWWRCFLNMLFCFFSHVALSGGGLSSLHRRANCPFPFLSHEPTNRTWKAESSQQKAQYETNVTYNCREVMYSGRDTENKGFCQNPLLSR